MPVQHAVLALLARGPNYGYEIKHTVEATLGTQWGQLNIGHVYQTLDRLVRDGAVTTSDPVSGVRADRIMYTITNSGREALREWLTAPAQRTTGRRDEFFLKLAAAAWQGRPAVTGVIQRQRQYLMEQLRALAALSAEASPDALDGLLVRAAQLHAEADLQTLEVVETHAVSLVQAVRSKQPSTMATVRQAAVATPRRAKPA